MNLIVALSRVNSFNKNLNLKYYLLKYRNFSDANIKFVFIESNNNERIFVEGNKAETVLDTALKYDVGIEAICNGDLSCSTCHVICSENVYRTLSKPSVEECDMLDMVPSHILTKTSRLCCQIKISELPEHSEFIIPQNYVDLSGVDPPLRRLKPLKKTAATNK